MTLFVCQISIANHTDFVVTDPTLPTLSDLSVCDNNNDGLSAFDLTVQNAMILAAQSGVASDYSITYHENLTDAQTGANPLGSPYYNINPNSQVIYVRIRNVNTSSYVVGQFQIIVNPRPYALLLNDIVLCDQDINPYDGSTTVNLTMETPAILSQQDLAPSNYTVSYYTNQSSAESGIGQIVPASNYVATNSQTIWIRVERNTTGCYAVGSFTIRINIPLALTNPTPLVVCDDDANPNDQYHVFNLTVRNNAITQGLAGYTVTYYPSLINAQNNTNPITTPTAYINFNPAVQTVGVSVTSPNGCRSITTLDIRVYPIPTPLTNPPALAPKCDINNPGDMLEVFDLTVNAAFMTNGDPSLTFHYFQTQIDAVNQTNEIVTPTAALVGSNVWIRVENTFADYQGNKCYVLVEQPLMVYPLPTIVQPLPPYRVCDVNADGLAVFDLTNPLLASAILGATQLPADFTISYYLTAAGANLLTNTGETPLGNSYTNITPNNQIIYIRVVSNTTGCYATGSFNLKVINPAPPIVLTPNYPPYTLCNTSGAIGYENFDLGSQIPYILFGQTGMIVTFYPSYSDAQNNTNAITNLNYINTNIYVQTLGIRVTNSCSGNYSFSAMDIRVSQLPVAITPQPLHYCDSNNDGFGTFDLNSTINEIAGGSLPSGVGVSFYETASDAFIGAVYSLTSPYNNINTNTQTIYVRVYYALTGCSSYVQLQLIVDSIANPTLISNNTLNTVYVDGSNTVVQPLLLDCQLTGNYSYQWQVDGITIPNATSSTYLVDTATLNGVSRVFTVLVITLDTGCFSSTTITVEQSSGLPSPIGQTSQTFNPGDTLATLTVVGQNIQWYASATSTTPLPLNTVLVNGTTYYATQTVSGIQSAARLAVRVQVTLGVSTTEILTLNYAPNPVKNVLILQSNTILKSVLVYNLLGQKVIEQLVNDSNATVDFSFLPSGNYMVKVQGETAQKVIKIVKQ